MTQQQLKTDISKIIGFSFDSRLASNLSLIRNAVLRQDFDATIVVDGDEGGGKSVLAQQIGFFLDIEHNIDIQKQICFYHDEFESAIMSLKPGKAIIWDEAMNGLNRRQSLSENNVNIVDLLSRCRQRNLFLIIVLPSIYSLDEYVAVHRARMLLHVWFNWDVNNPEKPLKRGFFRFYSKACIKELYTNTYTRRGRRYPPIRGSWDGYFPGHYVVDEQEYRKKKWDAESRRLEEAKKVESKRIRCPGCSSTMVRYSKRDEVMRCGKCGEEWEK